MENSRKILEMLSEKKIGPAEAEKLLSALGEGKKTFQCFNIIVSCPEEDGTKVKIRVPLCLLRAGMQFANVIPEQSLEKAQSAMLNKGIKFDLKTLSSMDVDELIQTIQELEIFVDDAESGESVRIFCE